MRMGLRRREQLCSEENFLVDCQCSEGGQASLRTMEIQLNNNILPGGEEDGGARLRSEGLLGRCVVPEYMPGSLATCSLFSRTAANEKMKLSDRTPEV
ncbi:hypothetical protein SRHO_G00219780 [Serrasalmus rhombeus]